MQNKKSVRPSPTALLNPRMDPIFKAIFTQETQESDKALQSFISSVLGRKIKNIKLTANEPPVDTEDLMQMSFDVSVTFEDGERASIEMQGRNHKYDYPSRSEIQVARLLNNNAKKGSDYKCEKVYQISVLNFHLPKDDKSEMSWYTMKNQKGQELSCYMNVIYIDLLVIKKLVGTPVDKLTPLQRWGLYLSYADDAAQADYIKQIAKSDEGIMDADRIVGRMSKEDSNWHLQNSYDIAMRDKNDALRNSKEEGLKEGLEQGAQQKAIEAARAFYGNGASIELIAKSLKMTEEQVREIVSKPAPQE